MSSRAKYRIGAALLIAPVLAAVGALLTYLGCGGATGGTAVDEVREKKAVHSPSPVSESEHRSDREEEALNDAAIADLPTSEHECRATVTAQVFISGWYTKRDTAISPEGHYVLTSVSIDGPTLVTGYSLMTADGPRSVERGRYTLGLAKPLVAAAYSIDQLCSLEERTPSYMRIACIDGTGQLRNVHYRIRDGRTIEVREDDESWIEFGMVSDTPEGACARLETIIESRDLSALHKAFMNDEPSERCRNSASPRRKVPAVFAHEILKPTDEHYESGKLKRSDLPSHRLCRGVTNVRVDLRAPINSSVLLGKLWAQCSGPCGATGMKPANGARVDCEEGGWQSAYQLGDFLYLVRSASVDRVPLPCGVDLDFRVRDFMKPLGREYLEEPTK